MTEIKKFPKRGEIWLLKNTEKIEELGKDYRPILIISNDIQNQWDKKIVGLPLTSEDINHIESFSVFINNTVSTGLDYPSKILCHTPFTLEKELRLKECLGKINSEILKRLNWPDKLLLIENKIKLF